MASYVEWAGRWRVPLHFVLAAVILVFGRPTGTLLIVGGLLAAVGLGVRAWAAGHLRRDLPLTVSGPYAYLRHPLYFGTAFVLAGFAVAGGRAWMGIMVGLYFALLFVPVLRREERERERLASELYAAYGRQVPALVPYRRPYVSPEGTPARFDWRVFRSNREWRAEVGCALLLTLLYGKMLWG